MPDSELIRHECEAHGTCSGLEPPTLLFQALFQANSAGFASVKVPSRFEHPTHSFSIATSEVQHEFHASNPQLPNEDMVVSCGNNLSDGRFEFASPRASSPPYASHSTTIAQT